VNRIGWRPVVGSLVGAAVVTGIVDGILAPYGRTVSPWALFGAALAVIVAWRAQRFFRVGTRPEPVQQLVAPREQPFHRLRFVAQRVQWSQQSPASFEQALRPALFELAADGLRRNHGIDVSRDPDRGAALLGSGAWQTLSSRASAAPTVQQLEDLVTRIEQL